MRYSGEAGSAGAENGEMIVEKLCWDLRTKKKCVLKDLLQEGNITTPGVEAVQAAMAVARTAKDDGEARGQAENFAVRMHKLDM
ncbi:MAG: hypothetical protein SGPRY_011261 [Prymnesium sp.]